MADFSRVVTSGLTFAGYDQGIDFTGAGDVFAAADGTITRLERGTFRFLEGTGSIIVYRISGDRYIYVMEAVVIPPSLKLGDTVRVGEIIGAVNSSYPGIEMGWATASGSPAAPLGTTSLGHDFAAWVTGTVAPPPGPSGDRAPPLVSTHQFEQAWGGLMRALAHEAPAAIRRSRAGRSRLRKAVR